VTGRRQSAKNGRAVGVESGLEAHLVAVLEFDPQYLRYEVQVPIEYRAQNGRYIEAHPDVLVYFADQDKQPQLIDAKYRSEIFSKWTELKPRFVGACRYARDRGWKYRLLSEVEIKTTYSANAVWLLPYRRRRPPSDDQLLILEILSKTRDATPKTLMNRCSSDVTRVGALLPTLWHLVATFKISVDLNQPINMASRIWIA